MIRWTLRLSALIVLVLAAYGTYVLLGDAAGGERESLAAQLERVLAERVSEEIAASLTFDPRLASLHVVPIRGDPRGLLREEIEDRLAEKGFVGIEEDASALARKLRRLAGTEAEDDGLISRVRAFLNESAGADFTAEEALAFGRTAGVSSLLLAGVVENGEAGGERRFAVSARVLDVARGESILPAREFTANIPLRLTSPEYLSLATRASSPWGRLLVWIGAVVALPFVLLPVVRRVLDRESNGANLLLLVGLSAVALALAWFLVGFAVADGMAFAALAGGGVLALAYNFLVCTAFERMVGR